MSKAEKVSRRKILIISHGTWSNGGSVKNSGPTLSNLASVVFLTVAAGIFLQLLPAADASPGNLASAIKAQNARYMAAYRARDVAAVTALHTEDGTVIAPNRERAKGLDAIHAFLADEMGLGPGEIELTSVEVTSLNQDTAYEIGQYKLTIDVVGGTPIEDLGDYVVIWKRGDDDVWRMHVDIWNTKLPLE
jgi:uncharacterized protein (TIGR02246 family)